MRLSELVRILSEIDDGDLEVRVGTPRQLGTHAIDGAWRDKNDDCLVITAR